MQKKIEYSIKKHYEYLKRRKQVLQNKPVSFRPTNKVKNQLEFKKILKESKSNYINEAIEFYMMNPTEILNLLCLKYPKTWRKINRRNGQFIKQKLKNEIYKRN